MPILLIIPVLSVMSIDCILLDLWNEMVDPTGTVEFCSDRYVGVILVSLREKRECQTFDLASNSENPYI